MLISLPILTVVVSPTDPLQVPSPSVCGIFVYREDTSRVTQNTDTNSCSFSMLLGI